ncbi:MAG TPA: DUF790 family protein [Polyangia bacterium]|nr:DUF790 family protein [Polyangia bacterium]
MLTADLVSVRRRGDELRLLPRGDDERTRAAALADEFLSLARAHVGKSRQELEAAWQAVPVAAREQRLAAGVRKLVSDRCSFSDAAEFDSVAVRAAVFQAAARARRALVPGADFDRQAVIADVALGRQSTAKEIEGALFADLHGAERLQDVQALDPTALAAGFDLAQAQGVLLRAVRVTALVKTADAGRYRALFSKLKFLRLLPVIEAEKNGGYRLQIDGPFSLFQSVTRYGVQLGLALPAIAACDRWQIEAEVLWGRERKPLRFRWAGEGHAGGADPEASVPDEVAALMAGVAALDTPWRAHPTTEILHVPGAGLCVPDLEFHHPKSGARVFLEVLGFWSREAVWRRIDLVRGGLARPIVFAVSKHLRVSEAALGDDLPGALYVYAKAMNARAVVARIEALAKQEDASRG